MSTLSPQLIRDCPGCGKEVAPGALACEECHTLIHGRELDALAREARALEANRQFGVAREIWQRCLSMLPPDSKQAEWIRGNLRTVDVAIATKAAPQQSGWAKKLGPLGPIALLLVKGKGILLAIFKLKFLLSLGSFVAIYWALYGWRFGVGFAASILIHELGHYIDIKRRGLPAEMPVFLPGLGAYVRWQALGVSLRERAQISLAGPLAGWVAASVCALFYFDTRNQVWMALGRTGAVLNVLNLIPIWILDGGQASKALARPERVALLVGALGLWFLTGEAIFLLVAAGAVWCIFSKDQPRQSSWSVLSYYLIVMAALGVVLHALPAPAASR